MTFQQQQQELVNKVVADLCGIMEYPDGMFPHTVFVEEEDVHTGEPVFVHYKLASIERSNATCILECPFTEKREECNLSAIEPDWLITVWKWCRDLMVAQDMWREHAARCMREQTGANPEEIEIFTGNGWNVSLSVADNIAAFRERKWREQKNVLSSETKI